MSQFDVYPNHNRSTRERYPYLLNIQSDVLDGLATRIVLPLSRDKRMVDDNMKRLTPLVEYDGETLAVVTAQIATLPSRALSKPVGTLAHLRTEIIGALDFAVGGV